jgi:hypothetical protein
LEVGHELLALYDGARWLRTNELHCTRNNAVLHQFVLPSKVLLVTDAHISMTFIRASPNSSNDKERSFSLSFTVPSVALVGKQLCCS